MQTNPISNIQEKASTPVADIVFLPGRPLGARKNAPPHPPHHGHKRGRVNGKDDTQMFSGFRLPNIIFPANLVEFL